MLQQASSLSQFVENADQITVAKRKNQAEFVQRGIAAIEAGPSEGIGVHAAQVMAKL